MPAAQRPDPIYQRGQFRLFERKGRNHEIVWYDPTAKRERSASAGSTQIEEAIAELDRKYLEVTRGIECCPTCRRPFEANRDKLVTAAIELARHEAAESAKASEEAINARLDHVVNYIMTLPSPEIYCGEVDERWIRRFREWAIQVPITSSKGKTRKRAPSTVENSVIQLASAIKAIGEKPKFKPIQPKEVIRTPQHRSDVEELARMFRYCLEPQARTDKERARRRRERIYLLRFLRASVATWARPDAVMDISTAKERAQWHQKARVLELNPHGRRQTRKRRATVPVAKQFAHHLDETEGFYIPIASVKSAWRSMARALDLPDEGESGMKLVRRSVMTIARKRLGEEHWIQGKMMAGHVPVDISDLYALLDMANLGRALSVTEGLIDELERLAPGAYYRDFTAQGGNVASIGRAKNG